MGALLSKLTSSAGAGTGAASLLSAGAAVAAAAGGVGAGFCAERFLTVGSRKLNQSRAAQRTPSATPQRILAKFLRLATVCSVSSAQPPSGAFRV